MSNSRYILYLSLAIMLVFGVNLALDFSRRALPGEAFKISVFSLGTKFKALTINKSNAPEISLGIEENNWMVIEPLPGKADEREILKLTDALTVVPFVESISNADLLRFGRTAKDFRLDEPRLTLKCRLDSGEKELMFGSETPTGDGVYAAVKDENVVYVLEKRVYELFARSANDFRARRVMRETPDHIRILDLKLGSVPLGSFSKKGDVWLFDNGIRTSDAKVRELLTELCDLEAKDFVWPLDMKSAVNEIPKSVLSSYGLDGDGTIRVVIGGNDGRETRFSIGKDAPDGNVYALTDFGRSIVTINGAIKKKLVESAEKIVENRVFPYEIDQINLLKLRKDDVEYVLKKSSDRQWSFEMPLVADADEKAVESFISRLVNLTPEDMVAGGVEVSVNDDTESASFAKVMLFKEGGIEDLRSREIVSFAPESVKRIVLDGASVITPMSVAYDFQRRVWDAERPVGSKAVNDASVKSILSVFEPLIAERIVKLRPEPQDLRFYGLDTPYLVVSIDRAKFDVPRKNLIIGNAVEGGRYATLGVSDSVFILPTSILERLKYDIILNN